MGFEFSINRIVTFVVLIVVGLLLIQGLISEGGWLYDLKEVILDIDTEFGMGLDEIQAEPVSISETHQKEIDSLQAGFKMMLKERDYGDVFYYFGGFSSFEDGVEIVLSGNKENVEMIVRSGSGAKQIYSEETVTIENMGLCVIAGKEITSNFYNKFLDKTKSYSGGEYVTMVNSITIKFDKSGLNENRIDYGKGFVDFEGDKWLFSKDNKNICFFPTVDGDYDCDGGREEGLDDDCLQDSTEEDAIPYLSQNGYLNSPGSEASKSIEEIDSSGTGIRESVPAGSELTSQGTLKSE